MADAPGSRGSTGTDYALQWAKEAIYREFDGYWPNEVESARITSAVRYIERLFVSLLALKGIEVHVGGFFVHGDGSTTPYDLPGLDDVEDYG